MISNVRSTGATAQHSRVKAVCSSVQVHAASKSQSELWLKTISGFIRIILLRLKPPKSELWLKMISGFIRSTHIRPKPPLTIQIVSRQSSVFRGHAIFISFQPILSLGVKFILLRQVRVELTAVPVIEKD